MHSIFYDLETSGLEFTNQILTACFVEVDEHWNVIDKLNIKVQLNPTEIPSFGAIVANGIMLDQHEGMCEYKAMGVIYEWLNTRVENNPCVLIGKNSYRFDLPFLRTSMIRNGYNPFFGKNIAYRDLEHVITKLYITEEEFRDSIQNTKYGNLGVRTLESVCRNLGLLDGSQSHEAESDVMLTIKLARHLAKKYDIDVRTYHPYEARPFEKQGEVFTAAEVYLKDGTLEIRNRDLLFWETNGRSSLFLDFAKFSTWNIKGGDIKKCFKWVNCSTGALFVVESGVEPEVDVNKYPALKDVSLSNFFEERNCYIENFIYRLPLIEIDKLRTFILSGCKILPDELKDRSDFTRLCKKFILDNPTIRPPSINTDTYQKMFDSYMKYRYGSGKNKMKTDRFDSSDVEFSKETAHLFHPTIYDIMKEVVDRDVSVDIKLSYLNGIFQNAFLPDEILVSMNITLHEITK